jgi:hypothetical protein
MVHGSTPIHDAARHACCRDICTPYHNIAGPDGYITDVAAHIITCQAYHGNHTMYSIKILQVHQADDNTQVIVFEISKSCVSYCGQGLGICPRIRECFLHTVIQHTMFAIMTQHRMLCHNREESPPIIWSSSCSGAPEVWHPLDWMSISSSTRLRMASRKYVDARTCHSSLKRHISF